ncbi:amidohydrolase family protein [Phenylobacterium sp.]|uniref:amidohydrolase family protein n=1 Tax=Phenylobacterium sp. TaxID=1871053 RepID=UPI00301E2D01
MPTTVHAIPEVTLPFAGQILDVDSHEHTPANHWVEQFGSVAQLMTDVIQQSSYDANEAADADDAEITPDNVWKLKRCEAPSSFDLSRRAEVLDLVGVHKQMLFPGPFGIKAARLLVQADEPQICMPQITENRRGYARQCLAAHNDWAVRVLDENDNYRPVAFIIGDTVEELMSETRALLDRGIRVLWLRASQLPGGVSPAHSSLDPFYSLLEAEKATLSMHVGADWAFLASSGWRDAEAFTGFKNGLEFSLDPWSLVNMSRAPECFLSTMVLGGVFERHPELRVLMAELSAEWIGPMMRRMDMWIDNSGAFNRRNANWPMNGRPSDYIRRNVRVSAFDFEDVGTYIDQYGLEDVLCYASDFPHIEGGKEPMDRLVQSLTDAGHGEEVMRKFFVDNAKWVLPD